ncbi:MAG TPA: DNA polymerase/3'-5' exonuclease PolX, partial [Kofleriaceae bacterium]|nr:DNA polymerase/3'-5' exonuclease PolX [Kofleriaceae bacterium]
VENVDIARMFQQVADLLELRGDNPFRIRAYRNAARTLESLPTRVADMVANDGASLAELRGIGKDLAGKIVELVTTDHCAVLDDLLAEIPGGLVDIMAVPGLGPKRAKAIHDVLGVSTIAGLERAARARKLQTVRGIGAVIERRVLEGLAQRSAQAGRILLSEADALVAPLLAHLRGARGVLQVEAAGSVRRRRETIGDLDLLASVERDNDLAQRFASYPELARVTARGPTRCAGELRRGLQVDVRIVGPESFGAALYYFTGAKAHTIAVRAIARAHKLKINEYGVYRGARRIAAATEDDVFGSVGLPYIAPELRENRGEIEAARARKLPRLVELSELRGDLQMHTTASDGRSTLAEMAAAARELGHEYIAITDHTPALRVTRGLDRKRLLAQRRAIERINERGKAPVVLWGAEVDILQDGTLDLDDTTLAELDLVVVSVHTHLDMPRAAMTERIVRALRHPCAAVLAHPTSRLIGKRAPIAVDVERLIAVAGEIGVLLEINAQPDRLDLDDVYARAARDAGVGLVISSDAHHVDELRHLRHGVDQARRGWCEARDIANTLPLRALRARLRGERRVRRSKARDAERAQAARL